MTAFLEFLLLGLAVGGTYGLLSLGVVVIYRGSGVLNVAQGAFAYLGATLYYTFRVDFHWAALPSIVVAVLAGFVLGAVTNVLLMSRMRSSPLTRLIATLAIMTFLESVIDWRINDNYYRLPAFLPIGPVSLFGSLRVGADRLIILGITLGLAIVLYLVYSRSQFGLITSAVASNERGAATLGHSPRLVGSFNWGIGAALGALAGVFLGPIVNLAPDTMTLLVVPALAAALVGGFSSFGYVMVAALVIGIAQSEFSYYVPNVSGLAYALPFAFIVVVPFFGGQVIPGRGFSSIKLPQVGSGRVRYGPLLFAVLVAGLVSWRLPTEWQIAFDISCIAVLLALSVVVISGFAGQLSLCQLALAGMAGWVTTQLAVDIGLPFIVALIVGPVVAIPIGFLVGLPSLRTRGVSLAIGTLGFAVVAENMIFDSQSLTGGFAGTNLKTVTFAGWNVFPLYFPWRFGLVALVAAALAGVVVANLRASSTGRRLLAVRSNERAAASLGIRTDHTKLYAFMVSAAIAGLGGVLFAYQTPNINYSIFGALSSITLVLYAVLAGVGFASGGLLAGLIYSGGLLGEVAVVLFHSTDLYQAIASGLLLPALLTAPDGIIKIHIGQARWLERRWEPLAGAVKAAFGRGRLPAPSESPVVSPVVGALGNGAVDESSRRSEREDEEYEIVLNPASESEMPSRVVLAVEGLTVRFGGVVAVDDLSFSVSSGQVVGLIGANGAGKTTVIDAISGFVARYDGSISLLGDRVDSLKAPDRAMRGIRRTFQSVELFDDVSLFENLVTACEDHRARDYVYDLFRHSRPRLSETAEMVIRQFGLGADIDRRPTEISYGSRRIAAIARALARPCNVLLLDEPTAGLDTDDSERLGRLVRKFAKETQAAVLLVEHNVDVVMAASDHVVVMDFGRRIAEGDPSGIVNLEVVQDAYLGRELATASLERLDKSP